MIVSTNEDNPSREVLDRTFAIASLRSLRSPHTLSVQPEDRIPQQFAPGSTDCSVKLRVLLVTNEEIPFKCTLVDPRHLTLLSRTNSGLLLPGGATHVFSAIPRSATLGFFIESTRPAEYLNPPPRNSHLSRGFRTQTRTRSGCLIGNIAQRLRLAYKSPWTTSGISRHLSTQLLPRRAARATVASRQLHSCMKGTPVHPTGGNEGSSEKEDRS